MGSVVFLGLFNETIFKSCAVVVSGTAFLGDVLLASILSEDSERVSESFSCIVSTKLAFFCFEVACPFSKFLVDALVESTDLIVLEGLS